MDKPIHIFDGDGAIYIDGAALDQFYKTMEQSWVVKGALMPDAHKGYSLPIGGVVATEGVIWPAGIGMDKGCGVCAIKLPLKRHQLTKPIRELIFKSIYANIPTGFHHNAKPSKWPKCDSIPRTDFMNKMFADKGGLRQLCSLGRGNHFIEIGYDENDDVWIIVHSGSRNVGSTSARNYMGIASGTGKASEGHFALDVDSQAGKDYIMDLNFCLEFALENRKQILLRVAEIIDIILDKDQEIYADALASILTEGHFINRNHNHAELKDGLWIHRKGATHAEDGMMGVIPGNMEDGAFIVRGKGNPDSLYSSSHGAGRVRGRKEAKEGRTNPDTGKVELEPLNVEDFEKRVKELDIVAKVGYSTVDESKKAYKSIFDVMEVQEQAGLVEIVHHIKPLINIKA